MEAFLRDGAQAAAACVAVLFTGPPGAGVSFGQAPVALSAKQPEHRKCEPVHLRRSAVVLSDLARMRWA